MISFGPNIRHVMSQGGQSEESRQIERPDSQHAAYVERLNVDGAGLRAFTQQKFDDEKRAQQKEEGNAEGSRGVDGIGQWLGHGIDGRVIHAMKGEDPEEGKETESVEFGAVETFPGGDGFAVEGGHA